MNDTNTTPPTAPVRRAPLAAVVAERNNWTLSNPAEANAAHARPLIDQVLAALARHDATPPAAVPAALQLADALTASRRQRPVTVEDWLDGQDLAALDPADLAARVHDDAATEATRQSAAALVQSTAAHLLERAVDALADDLDAVFEQLRPAWDTAARAVADARTAGIHSATTTDEVIGDDAMVSAWRRLSPAVAKLDALDELTHRALWLCGFPLAPGQRSRRGRAAWLDACHAGPVALVLPNERDEPAGDGGPRVGRDRSGVAEDLQADAVRAAEQAQREREQAARHERARLAAQLADAVTVGDDTLAEPEALATVGGLR